MLVFKYKACSHGGHTLATTRETKFLSSRGLDTHFIRRNSEQRRHYLPHERNVRVYLRGLGANSDIHVTHPEAFVRKQFHHPGQQNLRIGTLIGRVGVRKIITYIPQSGSTQKSITQSVESYICVTMPEKS